MLREVARKATQLLGEDQPFFDARVSWIEADGGKALRHLVALVPPGEGGSERVDAPEVDAQRAAGIAQRRATAIADDGSGQCGALTPVLSIQVLDDLLAPLVFEVDVDVGRLVALLRDEALEEQGRLRGVDFGDAERVADGRIGGRAAPLAEDGAVAREGHDVVDGEEIGFVLQFCDQHQLVCDLLPNFFGNAGWVAHLQTAFDLTGEIGARCLAGRDDFLRVLVAQLVEREIALRGDGQRLGKQVGRGRGAPGAGAVAGSVRRWGKARGRRGRPRSSGAAR